MESKFFSVVEAVISKEANFLNSISQKIWQNPELKFEEKLAHDCLTNVLKEKGFDVQEQYILPTAFRAEFKSGVPGPSVAVICEYDALPKVGHACGHNLIAESGIAAALAMKAAIESCPSIPGKVVVLGTPAEEGGGGKIHLIDGGAFRDIDITLMVHPAQDDHLYPPFIAVDRVNVTFIGKEAHASGFPWEGCNALDAAVACYSNVALLRQHIKPTCRIHGVITNGGTVPNVIPGISEMQFYFRAPSTSEMENLKQRLEACCKSAAVATGCQVNIRQPADHKYDSLITNRVLAGLYKKYAEQMGVKFQDGNPKVIPFMASSDIGNVSHIMPSIHPTFSIGTKAGNHAVEFAKASGMEAAQKPTLIAAKSMALLALEVLCNPHILDEAKKQFQDDLKDDSLCN